MCIEVMMIGYAITDLDNAFVLKYFLAKVIFNAPFLIFTYGLILLAAFYLAIVLLDVFLLTTLKIGVRYIMLLEWVIISPVFIYWAVKYTYWLWIVLITSFLITQLIRSSRARAKTTH
jgi:hypothetical protein